MRRSLVIATAALLLLAGSTSAGARLPDEAPETTFGVNGKVRAIVQVGDTVWVAGRFTQVVENASGSDQDYDSEVNLVAFDAATGAPRDIGPDLGGVSGAIVYDLAVGPDGTTVYAAGRFKSGAARNLVAFDGRSGSVTATYATPKLFSTHADDTGLYAGGGGKEAGTAKLWRVTSSTSEAIVVSVRTADIGRHVRKPQVVDIASAPQGGLFIACKCDSIESEPAKAFAHIAADGTYDTAWKPGRLLRNPRNTAFGWQIAVGPNRTYLAAGGSDFVMAVDPATGAREWTTDTNGSAQTVAFWSDADGNRVIVGGHWRLIEDEGNWHCQPRLAALLPRTGAVDRGWTPAPNPAYNGVWAVMQSDDQTALWTGGQFKRIAEDWARSGDDCVFIEGNTSRPKPGKPNAWARGVGRMSA